MPGVVTAGVILALATAPSQMLAGKLDDFERKATQDRGISDDSDDEYRASQEDQDDYRGLGGVLLDVTALVALAGGLQSWHRVRPPATPGEYVAKPRRRGEALIPFVRVDAGYQAVESDVHAIDIRTELGFGPFALQGRGTHYEEQEPDDELDLVQSYALYRISVGNMVEVDLGLGAMVLSGNETSHGVGGTVPVLIHPWDFAGLEFRPAWAHLGGYTVADYDLALVAGWRYLSVRAGYRWLNSGTASLNGPTIGVSARW